jgi:hypothetical protein
MNQMHSKTICLLVWHIIVVESSKCSWPPSIPAGCTELRIENNPDLDGRALAEALKGNTVLKKLYLSSNSLGDAEVSAIANALSTNSGLTTLSLYNNSIGDAGATAIAKLLGIATLTTLRLHDNQIGDAGAIAIAEALERSSINDLYLQSNQIGDAGAIAIAEALERSSITDLYLQSNRIKNAGAIAIGAALKTNNLILAVVLFSNQIGTAGLTALNEYTAKFDAVFFFYGNGFWLQPESQTPPTCGPNQKAENTSWDLTCTVCPPNTFISLSNHKQTTCNQRKSAIKEEREAPKEKKKVKGWVVGVIVSIVVLLIIIVVIVLKSKAGGRAWSMLF